MRSERPSHTLTFRRMLLHRIPQHAGSSTRSLTSLRRFSACSTNRLNADRSIYVSKSTNPYFNLTLEDWCVHYYFMSPLALTNHVKGYSDISRQRTHYCFSIETTPAWSQDATRIHGKKSTCKSLRRLGRRGFVEGAEVEPCTTYVYNMFELEVSLNVICGLGSREHQLLHTPLAFRFRPERDGEACS